MKRTDAERKTLEPNRRKKQTQAMKSNNLRRAENRRATNLARRNDLGRESQIKGKVPRLIIKEEMPDNPTKTKETTWPRDLVAKKGPLKLGEEMIGHRQEKPPKASPCHRLPQTCRWLPRDLDQAKFWKTTRT